MAMPRATTKLKQTLFWGLILGGVLLRLVIAFGRTDLVWPDEHFQTLEPAARVVFGVGIETWEWEQGIRSWFVPGLYLPLFYLFKLFGVTGGPWVIFASRALIALASGVALWGFHRLLQLTELDDLARGIALGAFSLLPAMVLWGPTTLSDNWAMIYLWATMPFLLLLLPTSEILCGMILGVAFLIRVQTVFWVPGLVLALLAEKAIPWKRRVKTIVFIGIGYLISVCIGGGLDWITLGVPFHSSIMQLGSGLKFSEDYGISPWYDYFTLLTDDLGLLFISTVLISAIFAYSRLLRSLQSRLILLPPLTFFLIHLAIGHKETRFLLSVYPALFYLIALGIHTFHSKRPAGITFGKVRPAYAFIAVVGIILIAGVIAFRTPHELASVDVFGLEAAIRRDGGLPEDGSGCILLAGHNWTWTRGELMQGKKFTFIEIKSPPSQDSSSLPEVARCLYAIVSPDKTEEFKGNQWRLMEHSPSGFVLFKKIERLPQ